MTRIVKQPEIRKGEIINTAQRLFYQKGFENTSVNDIVQIAGIAKGTFYHYFRAKSDIIDDIIEKYISQIADEINLLVEDKFFSPIEKLNEFFLSAGFLKPNNRMITSILIKLVYLSENMLIKEKMIKCYNKMISPFLSEIISNLPSFQNESAQKIAHTCDFIILGYLNLSQELSYMLLDKKLEDHEKELINAKSAAFAEATEKILGLENGTVFLMKKELIDKYFEIFTTL